MMVVATMEPKVAAMVSVINSRLRKLRCMPGIRGTTRLAGPVGGGSDGRKLRGLWLRSAG